MAGEHDIWGGDEWESHVLHLLQAQHGAHNVQKVPSKHLGDCGIDFICLHEQLVYQCYAVQEPVDVVVRAGKQKSKITIDIKKFCEPDGGAAAILKGQKIKRWILAVPLHDSKAVVEHAVKKAAEVRAKKLPHIDDDFQIIIQDRETFDADTWNYRMLLRKRIRPTVPEPTDAEVAAISDGDQTLADNLRLKMEKRVPDPGELEAFSFAMSITPGPNNLLLTTSGLTYGFRRTIPAMIGTLIGIGLLFLIAGAGVGALVMADPRADLVLRIFGAGYLVYLSARLWRASEIAEIETNPPLGVLHVAAFQFVNPKAWMMTISAVAIYAASAQDYVERITIVTGTFLLVSAPCIAVWAGFGAGMKAVLTDDRRRKLFNRTMAVLTLAAALFVFVWS